MAGDRGHSGATGLLHVFRLKPPDLDLGDDAPDDELELGFDLEDEEIEVGGSLDVADEGEEAARAAGGVAS